MDERKRLSGEQGRGGQGGSETWECLASRFEFRHASILLFKSIKITFHKEMFPLPPVTRVLNRIRMGPPWCSSQSNPKTLEIWVRLV